MKRLLYLVGEPGAGTSTLMRALLSACNPLQMHRPVPHIVYQARGFALHELGARKGLLSGTEALASSAQPRVLEWLASSTAPERLLAEGVKFANEGFFEGAFRAGYDLTVAFVNVRPLVAQHRRLKKAAENHLPAPNAEWVAVTRTRIRHVLGRWNEAGWMVNGEDPVGAMVSRLHEHPIFAPVEIERAGEAG